MNPFSPYVGADHGPLIPVMDYKGNLTGQWAGWSGWRAVAPPSVQAHHDFPELAIPNFLMITANKRGALLFKGSPYLPVPTSRLTAVVPPSGPFKGQRFTVLVSPESEGLWWD